MDLEHLTKSQIVLLTLLVSFVTSIATGIVTVALVEEAPTDVTRVVQRVVERTIEQVAPEEQQATVITKERTVIIKEADLIAAAISANKGRVVSVVNADTEAFVSLGVFIDTKGSLAIDAQTLAKDVLYAVDTGADELLPAVVVSQGGARGVAILKVEVERIGVEPIIATQAALQLGQTVVAFIGNGSITQGIVTSTGDGGYVGTSITGTKIAPGALLINVDGEAIGMSTGASRDVAMSSFAPIRAAFAQNTAPASATEGTPASGSVDEKPATTTKKTATQ